MLNDVRPDDKAYEQLIQEAVAQIPIYSSEWTNYNASDPGITILENLSAFTALQQSKLEEVPDKVKWKLLELAGFLPKEGRAARAYLAAEGQEMALPDNIPIGQKFSAHGICFEPAQSGRVNRARVLQVRAGGRSYDALLNNQGARRGICLFGESPAGGEEVFVLLDGLPEEGQDAILYFEMETQFVRNRFLEHAGNPFAKVRWELLTSNGYIPLETDDKTYCFLQSGVVRLKLPRSVRRTAARLRGKENAYSLRITLERADYDFAPCFRRVCGLLTETVQTDTRSDIVKALVRDDQGPVIRHGLLENGYIEVYGKEKDGLYYRYLHEQSFHRNNENDKGRYFRVEPCGLAGQRIVFEGKRPQKVMAVCRDASIMEYRNLGMLYGYDGQVMRLPPLPRVYAKQFAILVVEDRAGNEKICHVVRPEARDEREVRYSVLEEENAIIIHDCGIYESAWIRLGRYASYLGEGGSVLSGTEFELKNDGRSTWFMSCPGGEKGCFRESLADVRKRFSEDFRAPAAMVTKEDCRRIVQAIPGLSIHKIGVSAVPQKNELHVVIKPNSREDYPKLPDSYVHAAEAYLDRFRMLTTRVVVKQPVYVPIHVRGVVYVRKRFENCGKDIERMFSKLLDGVHSDAEFGSRIVFRKVYESLAAMDCTAEIGELSLVPEDLRHAFIVGMDIRMAEDALYYLGKCDIRIV